MFTKRLREKQYPFTNRLAIVVGAVFLLFQFYSNVRSQKVQLSIVLWKCITWMAGHQFVCEFCNKDEIPGVLVPVTFALRLGQLNRNE